MASCKKTWCLDSPAKLNLGLRLVGRRSDGYHLLESLFWPISLVDEIEITESDSSEIRMNWAADAEIREGVLPTPEQNILSGVLSRLQERVTIQVKKRIPMGAGLGGSSSNAGTVLRWAIQEGFLLPEDFSALGADVPFFLNPYPSWVSGIGEKVSPVSSRLAEAPLHFALLLLPTPSFTAEVFKQVQPTDFSTDTSRLARDAGWPELRSYLQNSGNDLTRAANSLNPIIATALDQLKKYGAISVGMSGSGSTCYAIFDDAAQCEHCVKDLSTFCRKTSCRSIRASSYHCS